MFFLLADLIDNSIILLTKWEEITQKKHTGSPTTTHENLK